MIWTPGSSNERKRAETVKTDIEGAETMLVGRLIFYVHVADSVSSFSETRTWCSTVGVGNQFVFICREYLLVFSFLVGFVV